MRQIKDIAKEIREDWKNISPAAKPYLNAMLQLNCIDDKYGLDSASEIVLRFLCNAQTWRGEKARQIKNELKKLIS